MAYSNQWQDEQSILATLGFFHFFVRNVLNIRAKLERLFQLDLPLDFSSVHSKHGDTHDP